MRRINSHLMAAITDVGELAETFPVSKELYFQCWNIITSIERFRSFDEERDTIRKYWRFFDGFHVEINNTLEDAYPLRDS